VALFADLDMPRILAGAGSRGRAGAEPALSAGYGHAVRPRLLPLHSRREGLERTPHRLAPMICRDRSCRLG
jgi:hypothetical protein